MFLERIKQEWTLSELVEVLGDNAPFGMIEAVNDLVQHLSAPLVDSNKNQITTAPPVQPKEKTSKYQERYNDFKAWVEFENPQLDKITKAQIHAQLIERNDKSTLWRIGEKTFETFWEKQDLYKSPRGRKKNLHLT